MPSKDKETTITEVKIRKKKKKQQQQEQQQKQNGHKDASGKQKMACCSCTRNRNSDILSEDPMLSDQHQYRYMTEDDMKSMGDDSMRVNVTDDEKDNRHSGVPTISEMITKESCNRLNAANQKPDNIDINRHPVHVGFLVSFLVDARGGAMRGCRHSGVRIIVPPRKATMPMRVTCRYLKRDKLSNPPPLMEGEALASRILELGPVGAKFLGPVIIEVPHFASLRGKEREIVILRSDNGETWREHTLEASEEAVQDVLNESFEGEELSQLEDLQTSRIVRILTVDFPHYFAVVSRIRQEVHAVGPEGGTVSSSAVPQVQAIFPQDALTKKIRVGLQAHPIPSELVVKLLGNRVAVSPIVTVEPRRRKFHKPITLTIPVPQAANKGMINQYSGDAPTLRLLCSITGGQSRAVWEDVTGSTPLTFVKDCVSFTTTVSARFWLMDCRNISEATKMATELYTHATHVPFMAKFVVFAKRVDPLEARLRVFCMTDDKEDKTLEHQEHFTEVAKSRDVEVLEGKTQYMEFAGNLVPVLKSGEQLQLPFRAFKENRVPFTARVKDPDAADMMGRIMFMSEPKVAKGEVPQTPICTLNILLPEKISPITGTSELDLLQVSKNGSLTRDGGLLSRPDPIHRATIRLTDISNLIDKDWEKLAQELSISPNEISQIKEKHPDNPPQQATAMFKVWQSNGNKATGNTLEKALNKIGRDDIVEKCIFNVELVTNDVEKAVARVRLDQPGFDSLKEELGPSRNTSLRRDATMDPKMDPDYEEPDRMKDSESTEELNISGEAQKTTNHVPITNGNIHHATSTPIKDKYASDEKELADDMADFLEHKCHASDSMTKKLRDETDDYNRKRQKVYEDAKQLVSGVGQDAEKGTGKLRKEGWSVVYDEDVRKYDEVGHVLKPQKHSVSGEIIEPSIVRQKCIIKSNGDRVFATVSTEIVGSTDERKTINEISIDELRASIDEIDNAQPLTQAVEANVDNENKKVKDKSTGLFSGIFKPPKFKKDKSKGSTDISFDSGDEDTKTATIKLLKDMQDAPGYVPDNTVSSTERPTHTESSVDVKYSTSKELKSDDVSNKHPDDTGKEKSSGYFEIFKSPKLRNKNKSHSKKKSSRDVSLDSGDEGMKNSKAKQFSDSRKNINNPNDPSFKNIDLIDANVEDKQQAPQSFANTDTQVSEEEKVLSISESKDKDEKSGGILNIFKSPKTEKKKSRSSKEPNISKEASIDSGDEQNRLITEKFLEDTKKISNLSESGHNDVNKKIVSDSTKEKDKHVKPVDQPASANEFINSGAPAGSDIKAITNSFLEDSRNAASVIDACPYKSLYLYKSTLPEEIKQKEIDNATKSEAVGGLKSQKKSKSQTKDKDDSDVDDKRVKEKKEGILSGIFKGMKHASKEAVEDVKDFADETKKEAIEEEEKLKKSIKSTEKDKKSKPEKSKKSDSVKLDMENEILVKSHENVEKNKEPLNLSKGKKVESINDKKEIKKDQEKDKEYKKAKQFNKTGENDKDSTEVPNDNKEKGNFLSGIIKSVKNAAEEVSEEVKEFVDETREEAIKEKEKLRRSASKERKNAVLVKEKISNELEKTIDDMESVPLRDEKPTQEKANKDKKAKNKDGNKHKSDVSEDVDKDLVDVPKKRKKEKEGLLSGFFKSSKHSQDDDKHPEERERDFVVTRTITTDSKEPNETILKTQQFLNDLQINTTPDQLDNSNASQVREPESDESKDASKSKSGKFLSGILKIPKLSGHTEEKKTDDNLKHGNNLTGNIPDEVDDKTNAVKKATKHIENEVYDTNNKTTERIKSGIDNEKEKGSGFLSGLFKSAKHASDEIADDVKEFVEDTKQEALDEEKKAQEKTKKLSKEIEDSGKAVKDKSKETVKAVKGKAEDAIDKTQQGVEKGVGKVVDELHETSDQFVADVNKDIDKGVKTVVEVGDETAHKLDKKAKKVKGDIEKEKEKGSGFLSGLFKSAKHATDEIADDVKEFIEDTKQEARDEEKKAKEKTKKLSKEIEDSNKAVKDKGKETVKSAKGKAEDAIDKTQQGVGKVVDELHETSDQFVTDVNKDLDKGVKTAVDVGDDTAHKLDKKAKKVKGDIEKEKEKGSGFLSGLFKSAKHATDEIADDVKEFVEETKQEAIDEEKKAKEKTEKLSKEIEDSSKAVKDKGKETVKAAKGKVEDTIDKTQQGVEKGVGKVVDELHETSDQFVADVNKDLDKGVKTAVDVGDETAHKLDKKAKKVKGDIEKEKEKGSGFLSGLFKSAKHATDEIADDVKEFVEDTKQEALDEEKKAKERTEKLSKEIEDSSKAVKDKGKETVKATKGKAEDAIDKTEQGVGKVVDDLHENFDQFVADVNKDLDKGVKTVVDVGDDTAHKLDKKAKKIKGDIEKEKEKGSGFLSGLFKSAKHATDEISDDVKEFVEVTKQEPGNEQNKGKTYVETTEITIVNEPLNVSARSKIGTVTEVVPDVKDESDGGLKLALVTDKQLFEKDIDNVVNTVENIESKAAQKLKFAKNTNDVIETDIQDSADASATFIKKEKEKGGSFLSSLFKNTKHASDDIADGVKEFIEETKQEALEDEKKVIQKAEKLSKDIKDHEKAVKVDGNKIADKTYEEVNRGVESALNAEKQIEKDFKLGTKSIETESTEKLKKKSKKVKDNMEKEIQDSVNATTSSIKKEKEKGTGFFSGLFKTAKHASDEIADDVKEFLEDTKQEALEEEEKAKRSAEKVANNVDKAKSNIDKEIEKQIDTVKSDLSEIEESIKNQVDDSNAQIDNIEKKITKQETLEKETAKKATENVSITVKESLKMTKDEASKVVDEFDKTAKGLEKEIDKATDTTEKLEKDVKNTVKSIETDSPKKLKKKTKKLKDDIEQKIQDEANIAISTAKKEKEKSAGFFSGLFKNTKHASEEAAGEGKELVTETEQKVFEEEKKTKKKVDAAVADVNQTLTEFEVSANDNLSNERVLSIKDYTTSMIEKEKENLLKDVEQKQQEVTKDIIRITDKIKQETSKETAIIKKDAQIKFDDLKAQIDKSNRDVSEEINKVSDDVQKGTTDLINSAKSTSVNISTTLKDKTQDIKQNLEQEVEDSAHTAISTTKKEKDKAEGFLSRIFKGIHHSSDEVDETDENSESSRQRILKEEKKVTKSLEKADEDSTGEPQKVKQVSVTIQETKTDTKPKDTSRSSSPTKKKKEKTDGYLSGILKSAKHVKEEFVTEVKEIAEETKNEAIKDEEKVKKEAEKVVKASKNAKDKTGESITKHRDDIDDSISRTNVQLKENIDNVKLKLSDAEKSVVGEVSEVANILDEKSKKIGKAVESAGTTSSAKIVEKADEAKQDVVKTVHDIADVTDSAVKKGKEKTSNTFLGLFKGAKSSPKDEVVEEAKPIGNIEGESSNKIVKDKSKQIKSKVSKSTKEISEGMPDPQISSHLEESRGKLLDLTSTESPIVRESKETDDKTATQHFLEDLKNTAARIGDAAPDTERAVRSESSSKQSSLERDSSEEKQPEKKKKSGIISSIVKKTKRGTHKIIQEVDNAAEGLKDATEKFWEDTKRESKDSKNTGSYDVNPSTDGSNKAVDDVATESIIKLTSSSQSHSLPSDDYSSNIPQIVALPEDSSRSHDIQSTSFHIVKESITVVTSNVSSSLSHSEPHAHQTVTTVITKSVRTAATPPPSPAELTDNVNKEITDEAARRVQAIIADREHTVKGSTENDFLQQSEPAFMETITTENNPETQESSETKITRTTTTITTTTSAPMTDEPTGGESMHKIVDQFMVEERKDHH